MDSMTSKEMEFVKQLKERTIKDMTPKALEDASVFYRFAKARNFNIVEAENMLRKHIAWRKDFEIDTILTDYEPPEVLLKFAPSSFISFDKKGNAVRLQDCGRVDVKGFTNLASQKDWMKYCAFVIEKDLAELIKRRENHGNPPFFSLEDFDNLTYANAVSLKNLQFLLPLIKMIMDNYPEILATVTIINAPFYFSWVYSVIKRILPSTVIQKVRIYGKDGWKKVLLDEIEADNLPVYLGGNRTDPDGNPLCETFIVRGQPIPKIYYMQNRTKSSCSEYEVKKLIMMPFSKKEITFKVEKKNSYIEWEFETMSRDIDFSVLFKGEFVGDFEPVVIINKDKIHTSDKLEKGGLKCERMGNYAIVFDNSSDALHPKEVYYRAGIKSLMNGAVYKTA